MGRTPHTACFRGKRVLVKMKGGESFVARFADRKSKKVFFLDHEPVTRGEIKAFIILKQQPL